MDDCVAHWRLELAIVERSDAAGFDVLPKRANRRTAPLETPRLRSVVDLQAAINRFLAETNAEPKPFTWTADPDKIIAAVSVSIRCVQKMLHRGLCVPWVFEVETGGC
jgi:hypothetical protein